MKHLIISREFPPAPGGGIGTYALHMSRLLAERGEQVHVIGAKWKGAERAVEELDRGRLVVHRVPFRDWRKRNAMHRDIDSPVIQSLFETGCHPLAFGWQASSLAEKLVEEEGIDLVEAQEFEAPLYFFQLRRALGFGPRHKPPCVIHLHSPMEFIVRYNDWDIYAPYFQLAKRCEDYSIRAADALLCPSRFLSRQAEEHYGLESESIETIPLPLGEIRPLERGPGTWERGSICYVGRLERRKGILEWIDAATMVARDNAEVRFELVGPGTPGAERQALLARIPPPLRSRFVFHGGQPRSAMPGLLARARVAVVPSRWENFPYACLEAMASGLPVIVSSSGGMVEMVTDGRSGWISQSNRAPDLAAALTRALATSPERLAAMGREATEAIHRICEPDRILELQLRFRNRVATLGARLSLGLPPRPVPTPRRSSNGGKGIALVITGDPSGAPNEECLASIAKQRAAPEAVAIACPVGRASQLEREIRVTFLDAESGETDGSAVKNAAVDRMLADGENPAGFAFLRTTESVSPAFVETCETILKREPDVGVISFWCWQPNRSRLWLRLCPTFPYQWLRNEASSMSVVRTDALLAVGKFRSDVAPGYENWDLVNAVLAAGWRAVTVPDPLATLGEPTPEVPAAPLGGERRRAQDILLARFPELVGSQAPELVSLAQSLAAEAKEREIAYWRRQQSIRGLVRRGRRILSRARLCVAELLSKAEH